MTSINPPAPAAPAVSRPRPTFLAAAVRAALLALPLVVAAPASAAPASAASASATAASATAAGPASPVPAVAPAAHGTLAVTTLDAIEVVGEHEDRYRTDRTRTATKTDAPLRDIPQSITVVTDAMIRDQAMQGMADVVRYVPGVQMAQGEGHRDAPILRGNTSTADFFVDGLRDDVQYYRDLYNVERVEALKGASGMIFGRGTAGGLINRVTKQADWSQPRGLQVGVDGHGGVRVAGDVGHAPGESAAFRVTALFEDAGSFRDHVDARRRALNPTATFRAGDATTLQLGFEHFEDARVVDRGVPSRLPAAGAPLRTSRATFFGDPARSPASTDLDAFTARVTHDFGDDATLVNHTRVADYDKAYQNVFPGAYDATTGQVAITAYSNATSRRNVLNQTDLTFSWGAGRVRHDWLVGLEAGRQDTANFRRTGYFTDVGPDATRDVVTLPDTRSDGRIDFRQSATDADNRSDARGIAVYVQDRIVFSPRWEAIVGVRHDRFDVDLDDRRTGTTLSSRDALWSPRAGVVFKPREAVSLYGAWSRAHVPRAGEQLASLTASNRTLDPERFTNAEVGLKWDVSDALAFTAAAYRLQRTNVAIVDPLDPSRSLLVDGQRVQGVELGLAGAVTGTWQVMAGYAYQDGEIRTPGAQDGNAPGQVPRHSLAVWNRWQLADDWAVGLGVSHRDDVFVASDNAVVLPAHTRVDAALYWTARPGLRVQANIENLFDTRYFASAHSNNNLMPGAPRTLRVGLDWRF